MASNIVAGSVVIEITGDNAQFLKALNNTIQSTRNFGKQFQNFFMTMATIRTTLSGFSAPLQEVFNVFSKFDFGMSKVQAITAATNVEISNLRDQAKLLGKTTFLQLRKLLIHKSF
jgi:hypothetical protein